MMLRKILSTDPGPGAGAPKKPDPDHDPGSIKLSVNYCMPIILLPIVCLVQYIN